MHIYFRFSKDNTQLVPIYTRIGAFSSVTGDNLYYNFWESSTWGTTGSIYTYVYFRITAEELSDILERMVFPEIKRADRLSPDEIYKHVFESETTKSQLRKVSSILLSLRYCPPYEGPVYKQRLRERWRALKDKLVQVYLLRTMVNPEKTALETEALTSKYVNKVCTEGKKLSHSYDITPYVFEPLFDAAHAYSKPVHIMARAYEAELRVLFKVDGYPRRIIT